MNTSTVQVPKSRLATLEEILSFCRAYDLPAPRQISLMHVDTREILSIQLPSPDGAAAWCKALGLRYIERGSFGEVWSDEPGWFCGWSVDVHSYSEDDR